MATIIKITPPSLPQETIKAYQSVNTRQSTTDRAGGFTIILPFHAEADISKYVVNTDVQIQQGDHNFRGFVKNPPVVLNGPIKLLTLEGLEYAAKTQSIVVTKSYTASITLSAIVLDLVTTYLPWVTTNIEVSTLVVNAKYPDKFLWNVLEQLSALDNFKWSIDKDWVFNWFGVSLRTNTASITAYNIWKGSADFGLDSSKLVNKLWVKGANAISTTTASQTVVVTTANITLDYKPHDIHATVGTATMTIGIQNVDAAGVYDFLVNYNEKLLIPDLTTTGTAVITYNYSYPVKILLHNYPSIATYGQVEDILKVATSDRDLATQMGLAYLERYCEPILTGSVSPFDGDYNAGEKVNVNIPNSNVNADLMIKSTDYLSIPTKPIKINLQLENRDDDVVDVLKQFNKRLDQLESVGIDSDNEVVEQYQAFADAIAVPVFVDGLTFSTHDYLMPGMPMAGNFYV